MNFTRACFCVATIACIAAYGLTGEWWWMVLAIGNGMSAYVFGPDTDDDDEAAA
jgi:hypothetical protein